MSQKSMLLSFPLLIIVLLFYTPLARSYDGVAGEVRARREPPASLRLGVAPIEHGIGDLNTVTSIIPFGNRTLLVSEQAGRVFVFEAPVPPSTRWNATLFLDLRDEVRVESELGFYGVALSPKYESDGTLYLSFINLDGDLVIQRYHRPSGERSTVITVPDPDREDTDVHRGGQIEFNAGLLYISTGDNAHWEPYDFGHPAQDLNSLWGKILRIDVESGNPVTYTIPADNPYAGLPDHRGEIWAYGLRNPYKFAFDPVTDDMYIGDVGFGGFEEVNFLEAGTGGVNFGWRCYEGTLVFPFEDPVCEGITHTLPAQMYPHTEVNGRMRCSVIGGRVYRESGFPALEGMYIFTDLCEGRIYGLRGVPGGWQQYELAELPGGYYATAIGAGQDGKMYVGGIGSTIYELVYQPTITNNRPVYLPIIAGGAE